MEVMNACRYVKCLLTAVKYEIESTERIIFDTRKTKIGNELITLQIFYQQRVLAVIFKATIPVASNCDFTTLENVRAAQ